LQLRGRGRDHRRGFFGNAAAGRQKLFKGDFEQLRQTKPPPTGRLFVHISPKKYNHRFAADGWFVSTHFSGFYPK
jgi:hypothetical protein